MRLLGDLRSAKLVADQAYGPRACRLHLAQRDIEAVIPAKHQAGDTPCAPARFDHNAGAYCQHNAIERTFVRIKQFHRFATRHNKRADYFLAWFQLADTLPRFHATVHTL